MTILAQQQEATFSVWDDELVLWQPVEETLYPQSDRSVGGETVPWTEEMVQELWGGILQGESEESGDLRDEILGWEALDKKIDQERIDIDSPSYFTEWDQSIGRACVILDGGGKGQQFTPEMLEQRENLNWAFNFLWNKPGAHCDAKWLGYKFTIPDTNELLTLIAVGDNHGVAKSVYGAVFVPRGALQYLQHNGGAMVGTIFDGEITFNPGNKFPWRLNRDGVKFTYEDMCGTRIDDDY